MADAITVARENVAAFNAADWDKYRGLLAPGAVYDEVGTHRRLDVEQAIEASKGWRQAFPDAEGTITNSFASGELVVLEITWRGTQNGEMVGPMGTIPPSGRHVEVQAVQVVKVTGDQISELRHYFDLMGLLQQVGAIPSAASVS